jgi:hypothetical protein
MTQAQSAHAIVTLDDVPDFFTGVAAKVKFIIQQQQQQQQC